MYNTNPDKTIAQPKTNYQEIGEAEIEDIHRNNNQWLPGSIMQCRSEGEDNKNRNSGQQNDNWRKQGRRDNPIRTLNETYEPHELLIEENGQQGN